MYGRLNDGNDDESLDSLRPGAVLRHSDSHIEFGERFTAAAMRAIKLRKPGSDKIGPWLLRYARDVRNLRLAWDHLVHSCGRAPGPNGERYEDFSEGEIWPYLRQIRNVLNDTTYAPQRSDEHICKIPKGPGRGTRSIVLQNIEHRIAQRAVLQIVQPLVDPKFDEGSMGGRPNRGPWLALATAEHLSLSQGRRVWVTQDIRDAFTRVPIPRLLQILPKYVPSEELIDLIGRILSNSRVSGLRQGGALSAFLLNLYLHHVLDRRWRKLHPDIPLIRYLDDILLLCRSVSEAKQAHEDLVRLLRGSGMLLKGDQKSSVRTLTNTSPAEWLGFRISKTCSRLQIGVGDGGWARLAEELATISIKNDNDNPGKTVEAWLMYFGPCYSPRNRVALCRQLKSIIKMAKSTDVPPDQLLQDAWAEAFGHWQNFHERTRKARHSPIVSTV